VAAIATRTAKPSYTDPCAHVPAVHVRTERIDHADDFMAGNARKGDTRHKTFDGDGVAVADAAGMYADADFVTARLGKVTLHHAKAAANLRNDHCAHLGHRGLCF
jgi:hypothetical protein